jgi:hypothetical protein
MTTASEDSTRSQRQLRPRRRALLVIAGVLVILLFALVATPRHNLGWIHPVTGSMKSQTRWFGLVASTTIDQSAIENWIIRREGKYENSWARLHDPGSAIWGRSFACRRAASIYDLQAGEFNNAFLRLASESEIAEFVRVMRSGTDAEKRQAVKTACDKTINRFDSQANPRGARATAAGDS